MPYGFKVFADKVVNLRLYTHFRGYFIFVDFDFYKEKIWGFCGNWEGVIFTNFLLWVRLSNCQYISLNDYFVVINVYRQTHVEN